MATEVCDYEKLHEEYVKKKARRSPKSILCNLVLAVVCFALGFGVRDSKSSLRIGIEHDNHQHKPLPQQNFVPQIPMKEVQFEFPTNYADTGKLGDRLWDELMPLGSGFLRVPYPRQYDMPPSKSIPGDHELAEIYSVSVTHQLHCLAVLRHVIMKYEIRDKSRFAGDGHEYHCLDYIRQAVLCAGDTTLDHADLVIDASGSDRKSGFTGTNATHQCRDWNAIKTFLVEAREGNKTGILS